MRAQIIFASSAHRRGEAFCIHSEKVEIDWSSFRSDNFPTDLLFDFKKWRAEFDSVITEEERTDSLGVISPKFNFNENYQLVFMSRVETAD